MKKTLDSARFGNAQIDIIQYDEMRGSTDPEVGSVLYFAQKTGINLRQVCIRLNGDSVATEKGALQYYHGNIQSDNKVTASGGFGKRLLNTAFNGESFFRPTYSGYGEVYLEPTFNHYMLITLDNDSIILDSGMFYCATSSLNVSITTVKNISSALFGSDGLTQTVVEGSGILVVQLPVPESEIRQIDINNTTLQVDGKFALMRTSGVDYKVSMGNKGMMKTLFSGEGLLETFSGNGTVWLAPTYPAYRYLSEKLNPTKPLLRPSSPNSQPPGDA